MSRCTGCSSAGSQVPGGLCIRESRDIAGSELIALRIACGGRHALAGDDVKAERSIEACPFVAHVRSGEGLLVGYLSALSDDVTAAFVASLAVHPAWRRCGIGATLMHRLEARYPGLAIHVYATPHEGAFFASLGYRGRANLAALVRHVLPLRTLST